jgi:hypothetical protein
MFQFPRMLLYVAVQLDAARQRRWNTQALLNQALTVVNGDFTGFNVSAVGLVLVVVFIVATPLKVVGLVCTSL